MISKTLHGARVFCYINGVNTGLCTGFSYSSSTPREIIRGIDSVLPVELLPGATSITGSIGMVRMVDRNPESIGLAVHQSLVIKERYFTVQLIDRLTRIEIFRADFCQVTGQNWTVSPKGLYIGTVNFSAITWSNESMVSGF